MSAWWRLLACVVLALAAGCGPTKPAGAMDFELEILRSSRRPIVFSTRNEDGKIYLRTVIRGGTWGAETRKIEWVREHLLGSEQATRLKALLDAVNFNASVNTSDLRDGDQWRLVKRSGWPRTTTQLSPDAYQGSLDNAGLVAFTSYLWEIADVDEKEQDVKAKWMTRR